MESLSDGVFAIAATLLVLDLVVPALGNGRDVIREIEQEWPTFLAYFVSFATIGMAWVAHAAITGYLERVDSLFLRLNLLLLFLISLLPFPTRMLGEYLTDQHAERFAATVYGVNLLAISVMISVLWRYAVKERLIKSELESEDLESVTDRLTPSLILYLGAICMGLVWPKVAVCMYLLIAFFVLIPFGTIVRRRRRST
jgi:uncharacterized membrane protein